MVKKKKIIYYFLKNIFFIKKGELVNVFPIIKLENFIYSWRVSITEEKIF